MLNLLQTTTVGNDLAAALRGEEGAFIAQRAGQSYLVVCEPGHSISSFTAIGTSQGLTTWNPNEGWAITKISDDVRGFHYSPTDARGRERVNL